MRLNKQRSNLGSSHAIHTVRRLPLHRRLAKIMVISASVLLLILIITAVWTIYTINSPAGSGAPRLVTIAENSSIDSIATQLHDVGVIRNDAVFKIYARLGPARGQLRPGPYMLAPSMTMVEVVDYLSSGKIASRKITIAEGKTVKQIAAVLEDDTDFANQNFEAIALLRPQSTKILQDLKAPASITNPEGLFYPDTYEILKTESIEVLADKMLAGFVSQVSPLLNNLAAENSKTPHPYASRLTPYERLILASIVEKEASRSDDRAKIAAVFYNRLSQGMRLESDPTINYATGKTIPSAQDLTINSPYNTYRTKGLPPTPICNPSLDSVRAVSFAEPNDYIFFIGAGGKVYFAKTYAEHQENIKTYLQ